MPKAIDSRNDVFITDHGSRCTRRSRARRVPRGRGVVGRMDDEVDVRPLPVAAARVPVEVEDRLAEVELAACCTALPAAATALETRSESGRLPVSPLESAAWE